MSVVGALCQFGHNGPQTINLLPLEANNGCVPRQLLFDRFFDFSHTVDLYHVWRLPVQQMLKRLRCQIIPN
jgi:hypothetical protein